MRRSRGGRGGSRLAIKTIQFLIDLLIFPPSLDVIARNNDGNDQESNSYDADTYYPNHTQSIKSLTTVVSVVVLVIVVYVPTTDSVSGGSCLRIEYGSGSCFCLIVIVQNRLGICYCILDGHCYCRCCCLCRLCRLTRCVLIAITTTN